MNVNRLHSNVTMIVKTQKEVTHVVVLRAIFKVLMENAQIWMNVPQTAMIANTFVSILLVASIALVLMDSHNMEWDV